MLLGFITHLLCFAYICDKVGYLMIGSMHWKSDAEVRKYLYSQSQIYLFFLNLTQLSYFWNSVSGKTVLRGNWVKPMQEVQAEKKWDTGIFLAYLYCIN